MFRQTDVFVTDSIRFNQQLEPKQIHAARIARNLKDKFDKGHNQLLIGFCRVLPDISVLQIYALDTYPIFHVITGSTQRLSRLGQNLG
jgi:hypothetical protein